MLALSSGNPNQIANVEKNVLSMYPAATIILERTNFVIVNHLSKNVVKYRDALEKLLIDVRYDFTIQIDKVNKY